MSYHCYTTKNKRDYQEDRYVIKIIDNEINTNENDYPLLDNHNITVLGVFDGHGGPYISNEVSITLPPYFYKVVLDTDNEPKPTKSYNKYILSIFNMIQNNLSSKISASTAQGTTVCLVLLYKFKEKNYITTINVGDSRSIACSQTLIAHTLTKDHKPDNIIEETRIINSGGTVSHPDIGSGSVARVNDILAVARSLGDFDTKQSIEHKPDIFHYINNNKFIVIATDGLWDVMSSENVCDFIIKEIIQNIDAIKISKTTKDIKDNIAKKLANHASLLGSEDNITIIIYFCEINEFDYKKYLNTKHHTNI